MFDVLGGEGAIVHEEHIHIPNIVDKEGFVSRWHHMAGFLVRSVSNLGTDASANVCLLHIRSSIVFVQSVVFPVQPGPQGRPRLFSLPVIRTLGIGACPLNRLLTQLSMPLGFLQLGSTHLNRSLW